MSDNIKEQIMKISQELTGIKLSIQLDSVSKEKLQELRKNKSELKKKLNQLNLDFKKVKNPNSSNLDAFIYDATETEDDVSTNSDQFDSAQETFSESEENNSANNTDSEGDCDTDSDSDSDGKNKSNKLIKIPEGLNKFDPNLYSGHEYIKYLTTELQTVNMSKKFWINALLKYQHQDSEARSLIKKCFEQKFSWRKTISLFTKRFNTLSSENNAYETLKNFKFNVNDTYEESRVKFAKLVNRAKLSFNEKLVLSSFLRAVPQDIYDLISSDISNPPEKISNWEKLVTKIDQAYFVLNNKKERLKTITNSNDSDINNNDENHIFLHSKNLNKMEKHVKFNIQKQDKQGPCYFHLYLNNCKFGDSCNFSHQEKSFPNYPKTKQNNKNKKE